MKILFVKNMYFHYVGNKSRDWYRLSLFCSFVMLLSVVLCWILSCYIKVKPTASFSCLSYKPWPVKCSSQTSAASFCPIYARFNSHKQCSPPPFLVLLTLSLKTQKARRLKVFGFKKSWLLQKKKEKTPCSYFWVCFFLTKNRGFRENKPCKPNWMDKIQVARVMPRFYIIWRLKGTRRPRRSSI